MENRSRNKLLHIGIERNCLLWKKLFETYCKCEPFILRISGDHINAVSHIRLEKYALCMKAAQKYKWQKAWSLDQTLNDIGINDNISGCSYLFPTRNIGMNWRCMAEEERTIEFRTFNGTLNPMIIQEYIFVVTNLVDKVNENKDLDVDAEDVIVHRCMSEKYIRKVIDYLCVEKEYKRRLHGVVNAKKDIDGFTWEMIEGSRVIDEKV